MEKGNQRVKARKWMPERDVGKETEIRVMWVHNLRNVDSF
jgi:hypothetical protein